MTEFKGTPGPWRYRSDQTGCVWAAEDVLASVYPNCPEHEINNVMGEWTRIHEMRANARLIAQAPTMYEYIAKRAADGDERAAAIVEAVNASR